MKTNVRCENLLWIANNYNASISSEELTKSKVRTTAVPVTSKSNGLALGHMLGSIFALPAPTQ